jgi:hypothetical protein
MIDMIYIKMAYKMDKYLISRLNVANSEFCENGVTCKIPHEDFEKLAGMLLWPLITPENHESNQLDSALYQEALV